MPRGLALLNGDLWTMRSPKDRAEAVLIENGRIARVGEERAVLRAAQAHGLPTLDAGGRRVLPGLIDAHTHLVHQGLLQGRPNLWDTTSKGEALARVRRAATRHRGRGPLIGERWDESRWRKPEWPTSDELDAITTRFPLILRRVDGHVAVANRFALEDLEGRLPGVDRDRGLLVEEASLNLNRVYPTPVPEAEAAAEFAQALALRMGVTTIHDFVVPNYFQAYQRLHRRGRLRLRVRATPYVEALDSTLAVGVETGLGDAMLETGGVKVFADGSIGGHTAALTRPYADDPANHGQLNWDDATLAGFAARAAAGGLQPSIHAIGDAAIAQVLGAYGALAPGKRRALRPRIEHFEVHTPDHIETARDLGLVLSMQPNFVGAWSAKGGLYELRFGDERRVRNNEFRRILDAGAALAFGSDCMPFDPWWGLAAVTDAPHPRQRLRLEEALWCYTRGSAYGLSREKELGSLAPGHLADLVVLHRGSARVRSPRSVRVEATMVGGRWVHGGFT